MAGRAGRIGIGLLSAVPLVYITVKGHYREKLWYPGQAHWLYSAGRESIFKGASGKLLLN